MSLEEKEPVLSFSEVSFRYSGSERHALRDISFSLSKGEFMAVLGDNGAGKSTLCKCANGIVPRSEGGYFGGTVLVMGLDTREHPVSVLASRAGLVLDDPDSQLFAASVLEEVAFGPENLAIPREEILESARSLLGTVGLSGMEERSPLTLSGGQKQRLATAAVLAMRSGVLVLDEPTSSLDGAGTEELLAHIRKLQERYGLAVLMATHDLDLVERYADSALLLEEGRPAAAGGAEDVLAVLRRKEAARTPMLTGLPGLRLSREPRTAEEDDGAAALRAECISYAYPAGGFALKNLSVCLRRGEFLGIIGRNGSGKTTLLKCLIGSLRPSRGGVFMGGRSLSSYSAPQLAARIAYVQQNPDLQLFAETVEKEVAFGPSNAGLARDEVAGRVRRALERVGLWEMRGEHPFSLHRGERALVALASVLAMESEVILLDEPTAGQDRRGCVRVFELIRSLADEGRAIAAVGHDVRMLSDYADRLIEMDGGSLREGAGETEFKEEPLCV